MGNPLISRNLLLPDPSPGKSYHSRAVCYTDIVG